MLRIPHLESLFPRSRTAPGSRVYAIGDVHGRADLLTALVDMILADNQRRPDADTSIILLGDMINKGPDPAAVLAYVEAWQRDDVRLQVLRGNHEQVLLGALEGDLAMCRQFHAMGGRSTIASYGVAAEDYAAWTIDDLARMLPAIIPANHRAILSGAALAWHNGDYVFAHAGWRDGVSLAEQSEADLLWTRRPYRPASRRSQMVLVHGHSNLAAHVNTRQRICVDTMAHATGALTAVGLEDEQRWFLSTATG